MKKRKNLIKRNSGFIMGCVVAAGASFFTSNMLMSDQITLVTPSTGSTEDDSEAVIAPEKTVSRTYETDSFTVTASGNIVKGVEEVPQTQTPQTDENGDVISTGETDAQGNPAADTDGSQDDGGYQDGDYWAQNGSGDSSSESGSYSDSYSGDSDWDGSDSDDSYYDDGYSDDTYYDQNIEIQDPGNGDYTYSDGSGSSSGSSSSGGSSTDDSSGGSSSGDSSGGSSNDSAWTPDDVILWGISSRYIDVSELYSYGSSTIRLIRNEIFALHGRMFNSQDLMDYFSQKSWYVPTYSPEEFDANMFYYLNDYEEANLQVILDYEAWLAENY